VTPLAPRRCMMLQLPLPMICGRFPRDESLLHSVQLCPSCTECMQHQQGFVLHCRARSARTQRTACMRLCIIDQVSSYGRIPHISTGLVAHPEQSHRIACSISMVLSGGRLCLNFVW
jgi:hypothetical protein